MMKRQHILKLESQLAELVENTFASLFSNKIKAQDIALELARAMERDALSADKTDPRPIAPDEYLITLHPDVHRAITEQNPTLANALAHHLIDLAASAGYRLKKSPRVTLLADATFAPNRFTVHAAHSDPRNNSSTAAMQPVTIPGATTKEIQAHLIINDQHIEPLTDSVTNIGRQRDNHIVIDDPTVSRYHVQIRLRFGEHIIFNAQSKTGTWVNDVQIREHRLKSGDVITLGSTRIVYMLEGADDDDESEEPIDNTGTMPLF